MIEHSLLSSYEIRLTKKETNKPRFDPQYDMELTVLREILKSISNGLDYASYYDLSAFFENLPLYCNKKNYKDITQAELELSFKKFFFSALNIYHFYFNIGQSNKDLHEYVIGS
jgi:hypothetical protein